ncbi:MAG: phosphonoacetaldehyde reductase [Candidatus Merdivicinus sp.]|jgi:alcohol dehydrogenase class IV
MDQFWNPVHTVVGDGAASKITETLHEMGVYGKNVLLLIWNQSLLNRKEFADLLQQKDFSVTPYCFEASNPTVDQLFDTYQKTRDLRPAVVAAVGGGSILDVGKSLCCLYGSEIHSEDELRNAIREKTLPAPAARWIGIPTTAGTGSEVTCWATIWDPDKNAKLSVESKANYAYAALVDPSLAAGMPISLAVSSGLDAAAHAIESYWAKASNTVSKGLALRAIDTIMKDMDRLIAGETSAHLSMAQGSMIAGLAFSNTKTTACHSISYPLTMRYHIPHGAAVSMLIAPVMKLNSAMISDLPALLHALHLNSIEEVSPRIQDLLKKAGIPSTLREWGAKEEDLPELAKLGMTKGRADNNPHDLNEQIILDILRSIY